MRYRIPLQAIEPFPMGVFYVYELLDSDGAIFYVGKGANDRYRTHAYEANRGCRCRKCGRIRAIWEEGGLVYARCVYIATDENDAWRVERGRIEALAGMHTLYNTSTDWQTPNIPGRMAPKPRRR